MFARVTCPACQYKLSIPEGDMGKRQICPNCQSPFFAGKSVAEAEAPAPAALGAQAGYARTLLGEMAPPIKYNCPRCKAPLEAPASEAGTKKPCPACGQRLQVPAAPPPAPAQAGLNKTMMASDESRAAPPIKYNCPNCKKPLESPASEAGMKKNCPACSQRLQVPAAPAAAPGLNKTLLASDLSKSPGGLPAGYPAPPAANLPTGQVLTGSTAFSTRNVVIAAAVLLLLAIAVPAFIRGGKVEDTSARDKAQQDIERLKLEIEQKRAEIDRQKLLEAENRRQFDDRIRAQDEKMQKMLDFLRQSLQAVSDQKQKKELEDKFEAEKRRLDQERRDMEKNQQKLLEELKASREENKRALDAALQRQQTYTPPPPTIITYPPYHPRYYWWW
jgi:DNA-directed RNA polymerase subunit RPC12/RpoP